MSNFEELIYNKDFLNKKSALLEQLSLIENKYIQFFQERENPIDEEDHDRLHNHYILHYNQHMISMNWRTNELPQNIMTECIAAFNSIFKE